MRRQVRALFLLATLSACGGDEWDAFVYPDANNLQEDIRIRGFVSEEACEAAAVEQLMRLDAVQSGDWECGKNCRREPDFPTLIVCE